MKASSALVGGSWKLTISGNSSGSGSTTGSSARAMSSDSNVVVFFVGLASRSGDRTSTKLASTRSKKSNNARF